VALDPAVEEAPARGVTALRAPLRGRARIAGGTFEMGSSAREIRDAIRLCETPTQSGMPLKRSPRAEDCEETGIENLLRLEGQRHEVTLRPFEIDRTEVRVEDYARCVSAGACDAPGFSPNDPRYGRPALPVTQVRWEDAAKYCAWALARLPTEAEWEFAARGTARRVFPWGDVYNPHVLNHGAFALDDTDASDGFALVAPVGSYPDGATPEGVLDMAGNVAEWVADFWGDPDENGYGYSSVAAVDPLGPPTGVAHVVRGGSFTSGPAWVRCASRREPDVRTLLPRAANIGFRCAADER